MPTASVLDPSAWTPERVSKALRLYLVERLSASAVAEALGGVSRAAVVAKVRRLGHSKRDLCATFEAGRSKPSTRARRPGERVGLDRRRLPPERPPIPLPPLRHVAATGAPVTLACLAAGACRWPIDDPGPARMHLALFCAGPVVDRGYCAAHLAIAFRALAKVPVAAT